MAPNPIMMRRKRAPQSHVEADAQNAPVPTTLMTPILATFALVVGVAALHWVRRWLLSVCQSMGRTLALASDTH